MQELERLSLIHPVVADALELIKNGHNENTVLTGLCVRLADRLEKLVFLSTTQSKIVKNLEDILSLQKESLEDLKRSNRVLLEILSGVGSFLPETGELNTLLARLRKLEKGDI